MGVVIRKSLQTTVIAYGGIALGYINRTVLFPKTLSPEEIGFIDLLIKSAMMVVPLVQLGMGTIVLKYYPFFRPSFKEEQKFLFFVLFLPLIGFTIVFGFLNFFRDAILNYFFDESGLISRFYYLLMPVVFFIMYMRIWDSYIKTFLHFVIPSLLKDMILRIGISILLFFYLYQFFPFEYFIHLYVFIYGGIMFGMFIYAGKITSLKIQPDFKIFNKDLSLKDVAFFGGTSIILTIGNSIIGYIDTIMVSSMHGLESTGIYSIAFFIGLVVELPKRSVSKVATPMLAQAFKDHNMEKVTKLYQRSALNLLISGGAVFLILWCNVDNVFDIMENGNLYQKGKYVILFIALGKLFDMSMGINKNLIRNSKYYYINLISVIILALVTIGTNMLLIPVLGITGAAVASAISIVIHNLFLYIFIWVKFHLQVFSLDSLKAVGIFLFTLIIGIYLPSFKSPFLDILYRSLIIGLIYGSLIVTFKVSDEVNNIYLKILRSLNLKE